MRIVWSPNSSSKNRGVNTAQVWQDNLDFAIKNVEKAKESFIKQGENLDFSDWTIRNLNLTNTVIIIHKYSS